MALMRRDRDDRWPLASRGMWDSPSTMFDGLRQLFDEDRLKVDEFTEGNQIVVRAELPGVDPDKDVDVSISDGRLCIRAERRQEDRSEGRNYRRSEIRYGSFSRVLPLPPEADESDVQANYKDGILEVRAPLATSSTHSSRVPISRT
jgi:HSP20 family protein